MKKEYYHNALKMLRLQLQEEEKSFELALNGNKKFAEIKEIKQLVRDKVSPGKSLGHSDKK